MRKPDNEFHEDLVCHVRWAVAVQTVEALATTVEDMNQNFSTPLDERMIAAAMLIKAVATLRGRNVVDIQDWLVEQIRGQKASLQELLMAIPAGSA